jgi:hypothetical protein
VLIASATCLEDHDVHSTAATLPGAWRIAHLVVLDSLRLDCRCQRARSPSSRACTTAASKQSAPAAKSRPLKPDASRSRSAESKPTELLMLVPIGAPPLSRRRPPGSAAAAVAASTE